MSLRQLFNNANHHLNDHTPIVLAMTFGDDEPVKETTEEQKQVDGEHVPAFQEE